MHTGAGVGFLLFPLIFMPGSAINPQPFQGSGSLSNKEQSSCVKVVYFMGSDIDGSGPGSLFPLEQRCVLKGRPYSSEQGVLFSIL